MYTNSALIIHINQNGFKKHIKTRLTWVSRGIDVITTAFPFNMNMELGVF